VGTHRTDGPDYAIERDTETKNQTTNGSKPSIEVRKTGTNGPYQFGPREPDCPSLSEDGDDQWGMMTMREGSWDYAVSSPEDAGRLLIKTHERYTDGVVGDVTVYNSRVDEIRFKDKTENIPEKSATGRWYILNPSGTMMRVVIPQSEGKAVLRSYIVGDC
jgi:hypothetical protein